MYVENEKQWYFFIFLHFVIFFCHFYFQVWCIQICNVDALCWTFDEFSSKEWYILYIFFHDVALRIELNWNFSIEKRNKIFFFKFITPSEKRSNEIAARFLHGFWINKLNIAGATRHQSVRMTHMANKPYFHWIFLPWI